MKLKIKGWSRGEKSIIRTSLIGMPFQNLKKAGLPGYPPSTYAPYSICAINSSVPILFSIIINKK